jgi:hypothetical protein
MRHVILPAISLLLASCAAGDTQGAVGTATRDSAGVRIVQNPEQPPAQWTVSPQPGVVIGSTSGDSAYLFDRVMGLVRLSDGRWVVADMGSSQLRYYDANGHHLLSVGRNGEGPGEFRQLMAVFLLRGDTIAADDSRYRHQLFDEKGNFVASLRMNDHPSAQQYYPIAARSDGTVIVLAQAPFPQKLDEPRSYAISYMRAELTHTANAAELTLRDTAITWNAIQLMPGWRGGTDQLQFSGRVDAAVLSDGFAVADPNSNEVRYYDSSGALRTIARGEGTRVAVTEEHKEALRARMIDLPAEGGGQVPESLRRQRMEITKTWQYAEHLPVFAQMLAGSDGTIWLRDFVENEKMIGTWHAAPASPARWSALDRSGELLASVQLPGRFKPMLFGEDFVAGLYRDDEDVEFVHVYSIARS